MPGPGRRNSRYSTKSKLLVTALPVASTVSVFTVEPIQSLESTPAPIVAETQVQSAPAQTEQRETIKVVEKLVYIDRIKVIYKIPNYMWGVVGLQGAMLLVALLAKYL